jgi:hypothetical protein
VKRVTLQVVGLLMAATLVLTACGQQPEAAEAPADQPAQETATSAAGPLRIPSEHGGFMVIGHRDDGPTVSVNFDDPATRDTYFAANRERIATLLTDPPGNPIEVKVTFQKPVKWEQFVALRDDVGLQPWAYEFVGSGPNGEKAGIGHSIIPDDELIASVRNGMATQGARLAGVLVAEGTIPVSAEGLGKLADDSRVLLVDTTSVEAMQILEEHGIPVPSIDDGPDVLIPSPFWDLDWRPQE